MLSFGRWHLLSTFSFVSGNQTPSPTQLYDTMRQYTRQHSQFVFKKIFDNLTSLKSEFLTDNVRPISKRLSLPKKKRKKKCRETIGGEAWKERLRSWLHSHLLLFQSPVFFLHACWYTRRLSDPVMRAFSLFHMYHTIESVGFTLWVNHEKKVLYNRQDPDGVTIHMKLSRYDLFFSILQNKMGNFCLILATSGRETGKKSSFISALASVWRISMLYNSDACLLL